MGRLELIKAKLLSWMNFGNIPADSLRPDLQIAIRTNLGRIYMYIFSQATFAISNIFRCASLYSLYTEKKLAISFAYFLIALLSAFQITFSSSPAYSFRSFSFKFLPFSFILFRRLVFFSPYFFKF